MQADLCETFNALIKGEDNTAADEWPKELIAISSQGFTPHWQI